MVGVINDSEARRSRLSICNVLQPSSLRPRPQPADLSECSATVCLILMLQPLFCWVMHFLALLRSSRCCRWITSLSAWHCLCQGAEACSYQTRLETHLVTALWRWQGMGLMWSSIHSASCHFFAGKGNKLEQFIHWMVSTSHIYYLFHVVHSHLDAEFQRVEVKSHR